MPLTPEQIASIPKLKETMPSRLVAEKLGISIDMLKIWITRLRNAGYKVPGKVGRPKIYVSPHSGNNNLPT